MSTTTDDLELIIWYYVRNEYENKFNETNIPMQLKYLIVLFSKRIIGSKLLTLKEDIAFTELFFTKMSSIKRFNLLFRASEHRFKSKEFHNQCDNNGSTLTIIKSHFGNIFGGYTNIPWRSSPMGTIYNILSPCINKYNDPNITKYNDPNAFLFLIRSDNETNQNICPLIFKIKNDESHSVLHHARGPSFGGHNDLCIRDNCNWLLTNYVNPFNYDYGLLEGPLCGGNLKDPTHVNLFYFQVLEYEVFQIQ